MRSQMPNESFHFDRLPLARVARDSAACRGSPQIVSAAVLKPHLTPIRIPFGDHPLTLERCRE